jgi:hypothetical protein
MEKSWLYTFYNKLQIDQTEYHIIMIDVSSVQS